MRCGCEGLRIGDEKDEVGMAGRGEDSTPFGFW